MSGVMDMFMLAPAAFIVFMGVCVLRGVLGPTKPDRVVALDTINTLVVVSMISLGVAFKEVVYIDVSIVYGLLSFIGTLYMADYLEGGH